MADVAGGADNPCCDHRMSVIDNCAGARSTIFGEPGRETITNSPKCQGIPNDVEVSVFT
nr:hypothetical protein [Kibdelosporangium sp. MJ126-NF4]CTQ94618.1 hypothetical protein [Kibdelosporangium sp. MJ126-NF4]